MKIFVTILSILVLLASIIPFLKSNKWFVRVFDYPRFQKLVLVTICLILWFVFINEHEILDWILLGLLSINFVYLVKVVLLALRVQHHIRFTDL